MNRIGTLLQGTEPGLQPEDYNGNGNDNVGKYYSFCKKKNSADYEEDNSNNWGNYQQSKESALKKLGMLRESCLPT